MGRQMASYPSTHKVISPPTSLLTYPMVSSLIDPAIKWWRAETIRAAFLPFEVDAILKISLNHSLPDDKLIWIGNNRGEFTIKSAYLLPIAWLKQRKKWKVPRGTHSSLFGRTCGTSNFLPRLKFLHGGLVSTGCKQWKRFALEASLLVMNVQSAVRN